MGRTIQVAADRAQDDTKTVLPAEVARGLYVRNPPGLRALKLMHLMIATAAGRMAEDVRHEMRLSEIRRIPGMGHHDKESLTPLFEDLAEAVLTYDDPEAKTRTIGGFLDEAVLDYRHEVSGDVLVTWYFRRTFRRMAAESNLWAILDRQTVFALTSKYSILLFQHIASLSKLAHVSTKIFTVAELRAVLGIPAGKLTRFSNLKGWALMPAIEEINQLSRFTLTATPRKIGRTVASVEIAWTEKLDARPAKVEARRAGAVAPVADPEPWPRPAFPETGGIAYSPRWLALKEAAGCTHDNLLIGSDFRAYLKAQGIRRDAPHIEAVFSDWCRERARSGG